MIAFDRRAYTHTPFGFRDMPDHPGMDSPFLMVGDRENRDVDRLTDDAGLAPRPFKGLVTTAASNSSLLCHGRSSASSRYGKTTHQEYRCHDILCEKTKAEKAQHVDRALRLDCINAQWQET